MSIIVPIGGLGNRLRVILSYLETRKRIKVIWRKTAEIAGAHFLDVFEPINGIEFVSHPDRGEIQLVTCIPANLDWFNGVGVQQLALIKALPHIQQRINALPTPQVAIHVRRTDHSPAAQLRGQFTSDQMFFDFIDGVRKDTQSLYVATDNSQTAHVFAQRYPGAIIASVFGSSRLRQTSLEDSVVDWFMCVRAQHFMGSGYSSFTDLIQMTRASPP